MEEKRRGRPKIEYDSETAKKVQAMSQYGTPQEEIADAVDISVVTLRKIYKKELKAGLNAARLSVRKKLFEGCMAGDTALLIFYAKTQLGWREKDRSGQGGGLEVAVRSGDKALLLKLQEAYGNEEPEE